MSTDHVTDQLKRLPTGPGIYLFRNDRGDVLYVGKAKSLRPDLLTKSSLMVGLGETDAEVSAALRSLRSAGVDLVTLGQYLSPGRPGMRFLPVARFVTPEQFAAWEAEALALGFLAAACGPLVRSSFRAGVLLEKARGGEPGSGEKA